MLHAFRFLLVLLMLSVLALLSAITTMHFAIHGTEVKVPSFKGLTSAEAASRAAALGLNLKVDNHFYSVDIPAGRIVSQSPAPGILVRREWNVRVIESLGPQRVAVPNLTGLDQRVASIQIRRADLEVGSAAEMPWTYAAEGSVIAQNPAPGAAGVERPTVSMLIAAPPIQTNSAFVMPSLTGQTLPAAEVAITRVGLQLAPVIYATAPIPAVPPPNSTQPMQPVTPPGTISSQNPQPGQRVDASTPIELTVAQ